MNEENPTISDWLYNENGLCSVAREAAGVRAKIEEEDKATRLPSPDNEEGPEH